MASSSNSNTFKCALCDNIFTTNKALISHKTVHDGENRIFTCNCGKTFTDHCEYLLHEATHLHHKDMYKCVECGVTKKKSSVTIHILTHFKQREQPCDICGVVLSNDKMKVHAKTHSSFKTSSKCTICGKTIVDWKKDLHMKNHEKEQKIYTCQYCGKVFTNKYEHHYHLNMHMGLKTEICEICGFRSHNPKTLSAHKKKHAAGKKFECDYCKHTLFDRNVFVSHIRRHKIGFECRYKNCKFTAPTTSEVKQHRFDTHYYCKVCNVGFHKKQLFQRHNDTVAHKDKMIRKNKDPDY